MSDERWVIAGQAWSGPVRGSARPATATPMAAIAPAMANPARSSSR